MAPADAAELLAMAGISVGPLDGPFVAGPGSAADRRRARTPDASLVVRGVRDPAFGPLLVLAGADDDPALARRAVLLAPVSAAAARRALEPLRRSALVGPGDADLERLVPLVVALGLAMATVPELAEVVLGPVDLVDDQWVVGSVRVAVAPRVVRPLRALRPSALRLG